MCELVNNRAGVKLHMSLTPVEVKKAGGDECRPLLSPTRDPKVPLTASSPVPQDGCKSALPLAAGRLPCPTC